MGGITIVFINLEKPYDRVPREVLWNCMEKKDVSFEDTRRRH